MELMQLSDRPAAVFSCNNDMTLGLLRAMYQLHVRCPEHVIVLGFDDFVWPANFSPRLTTVAQPTLEMGKQAVQMLLVKIESFKKGLEWDEEKVVALKAELRICDSTAAPCPIDTAA
jgi:DNA-binding LacI/PurR family transcriptional regulator